MAASRLVLRELVEADLADALALSRICGWNQTLEDWRLLVSLGPGLFRVAEQDGKLVATAGAVRYGFDLAWLCMVLVLPDRRGQGVGAAVFDDALARLTPLVRAGELRGIGLDATPAGRGLYLRRGFVDGPALARWRLVARPSASPEAVRPLEATDLADVLEADRLAFGADRSAALRAALRGAPRLAWIAREGARAGYCFGRHGEHSDHAGPVIANDVATAGALVLACASAEAARPLVVDAFSRPAWTAALEASGFQVERPFSRMYHGLPPSGGESARVLAAFGPELG